MIGRSGLAVLAVVSLGAVPAEDEKTLVSKITEVTVYADRARVTRVATVDVPAAGGQVAFRALPGWIDEGSVRLAVSPPDAAQILDVEVRRTFLSRPDELEVRKAENAVRETADEITALDDEKRILDAQAKQIEAIRLYSLEKLPKDAAVRDVKIASYGELVEFVAEALRKNAKAQRETDRKKRDLAPELAARQRALQDVRSRAQLEQRSVVVTLKDGPATRNAKLELTYLLPGATWEPVQELRATDDAAAAIAIASYAAVTQTTGEDWEGAALTFSTQRPTDTMQIPELQALLVGAGGARLAQVVGRNEDTFAKATLNYSGQSSLMSQGRADILANMAVQTETQQRVDAVFRKLQERGTTAHFTALGAGSTKVRADGRAVRVPIGVAKLDAKQRIVAAPEVSLNAARTVDLVNTGEQPLLPGKVSLYHSGAFLGTTEMDFVAQGEPFSMFMGTADRVKLSRTLDKKRSRLTRLGKRTRIQASYVILAENLSPSTVALQIADRLPVSQAAEVRVDDVTVTPEIRPDTKGLLRWDVQLAAKQTKSFRIEYTLEYPTEWLERERSQRRMNAPRAKDAVYDEIDRLENTL